MAEASIGRRIAVLRRRRGLSQAAVAGLVGRSESWLSQVERGLRDVASYPVLRDLARVLRVDLDELAGVPAHRSSATNGHKGAQFAAVERAVLLGAAPADIDTVAAVAAAHDDYQAALYADLIDRMPRLIGALDAPAPPRLLVSGYSLVAKLLTKVGRVDLALIAADRARLAAARTGDAADLGMAAYQVVCALIPTAHASLAREHAVGTAELLDGDVDAEVVSVSGALWLIAAVAAARAGSADEAWVRLARASRQADRLGADANHRWTAFGPTNVAIHRLSVAVELGDAAAAVDAVREIDLDRLPRGLVSRRAQVQLDLAWANARRRRDAEALVALLEVERRAPQVSQRNVVARDVIRQLLVRSRGPSAAAVHALADRAGVTL